MRRTLTKSVVRKLLVTGLSSSLLLACAKQEAYSGAGGPHSQTSPNAPNTNPSPADPDVNAPDYSANQKDQILKTFAYVDPSHQIDQDLLHEAELYFYANKSKFKNVDVLTVIDYAKWSGTKRFFLIDMKTGSVWSTYVAHGSGSDPGTYDQSTGYARYFSNTFDSNMTSLGPFRTTDATQSPKHGYVLHLAGLASTNSNAAVRAIEVHGADYVNDAPVKQGRSQGCPALPLKYYKQVIDQIKDGSLIYAGRGKSPTASIAQN